MSTRACYTFKDEDGEFHVYKHYDGYPSGAVQWINAALAKAWPLPRFEADEFAAAFVAANKDSGGSVRLMQSGDIHDVAPGDIEWHYLVEPLPSNGKQTTNLDRLFDGPKDLYVTVRTTEGRWPVVWRGKLSAMEKWANRKAA